MRLATLLAIALAAFCAAFDAQAQTYTDAGDAMAECQADAKREMANRGANARNPTCAKRPTENTLVLKIDWRACDTCGWNNAGEFGYYSYFQSCASRNTSYPLADAQPGYVPVPNCVGGCKTVGEPYSYAQGGVMVYGMRNRTYVDEVCAVNVDSNAPIDAQAERDDATEPKAPECTALGNGQTACVKPDGDYCATASNGKTHCWTPNEEGVKVDGEDAQRKSEQGKPVLPPDVSIPDKDWQRKEGHQSQACVNNTCKTYNITNYSTVAAGTAKNSTGDNKADGTGNTSGNGTSTGSGSGSDDEGDSASESGNCDTPPACTGDTLKCLHLKITWRIDCNTKGNEITDSNGCGAGDVPVCAGKSCKAEQYATLLRDWRRRCEFVADAQNGVADGQGDDEAGVIGGLWNRDGEPEPEFDTGKVSVGGGGDLFPEVQIYGTTFSVPPSWYDLIAKIRLLVIASFMIAGFWIVARM